MPDVNVEKLAAELTKTVEEVALRVAKQDAEIKAFGAAKDSTGTSVDRIDMGQGGEGLKPLAQILHEDKSFQEALNRGAKSCDPVQIKGGLRPYMEATYGPSLVKQLTTAAGSMGAMIRPDRVP